MFGDRCRKNIACCSRKKKTIQRMSAASHWYTGFTHLTETAVESSFLCAVQARLMTNTQFEAIKQVKRNGTRRLQPFEHARLTLADWSPMISLPSSYTRDDVIWTPNYRRLLQLKSRTWWRSSWSCTRWDDMLCHTSSLKHYIFPNPTSWSIPLTRRCRLPKRLRKKKTVFQKKSRRTSRSHSLN